MSKAPNGKKERYYTDVGGRELTADEIAYFQHVISELPPVVKKASESREAAANSSATEF